jgi:methylaspartate ammonia-lyase
MSEVMHISRVVAIPVAGAGYYEDLAALQASPLPVAERFTAAPVTPGFRAVREVAEAVAVGLVLDDGRTAWGDCVAVSYSGQAGREPVFRAEAGLAAIECLVAPGLQGRELTSFRDLAAEIDALAEPDAVLPPAPVVPPVPDPSRRALLTRPLTAFRALPIDRDANLQPPAPCLHTAIRYGASQALLGAVALARGVTMAEVICQEWDLPCPGAPLPLHAQCGADRYAGADKMIVRRIASLPHALVDDVEGQVGKDGAELTRYIRWLSERIGQLGGADYQPTIHLDIYGALGRIYDGQMGRMLGQLYAWEMAAQPYPLRIECPVMLDTREAQIETMKTLRDYVRSRRMTVQLVADEWANTLDDIRAFVKAGAADMIQIKMPDLGGVHHSIEAVLACKTGGVHSFLGGSYAETDLSARVSLHVALATQPDLVMAKPGMGVDEAISLAHNEMARTLAAIGGHERERGIPL